MIKNNPDKKWQHEIWIDHQGRVIAERDCPLRRRATALVSDEHEYWWTFLDTWRGGAPERSAYRKY